MQPKIYSSYEEIDYDLAVLKLEKELHFQKASLHLNKAKDSIVPDRVAIDVSQWFAGGYSGLTGSVVGFIVMMLVRKIFNRR